MKKKLLALLLVVSTVFSLTVPVAAVDRVTFAEPCTKKECSLTVDGSYPMFDIGEVFIALYQVNKLLYDLTGAPCFKDQRFNVTVDETAQGLLTEILDNTGVDFTPVFSYLPETNQYAEFITTTLKIDIPVFQDKLMEAVHELNRKGRYGEANIVHWFAVWIGIIDECKISLLPENKNPGVYRFAAVVTYRDGRNYTFKAPIYYDSNTNEIRGAGDNPALLGFNMNLDQNFVYTGVDVWQRNFGFCLFYDFFCFMTPYWFDYVTERFKFEYDNREFMIQIWKGKYAITNGGEVGIYTRPLGSKGSFYNCASDEDMIPMSLAVYHGDDLILSRDKTLHWWVTGFAVSDTAYLPRSLTLVSTLTMKDQAMLDAFVESIEAKKRTKISYVIDGLDITITW